MIVWLLPLVSVHAVLSGRGNCGGEEEELIMISKAETRVGTSNLEIKLRRRKA
jgi:hypothetical protein